MIKYLIHIEKEYIFVMLIIIMIYYFSLLLIKFFLNNIKFVSFIFNLKN